MVKEFKKFIFKGNSVDLAVGIIIGSAFTGIVNSLVNNIIMPFVGVLTAGVDFKDITINLSPLARLIGSKVTDPTKLTMSIGLFINGVVEFLILAITIFFVVKAINASRDKMEELSKKKGKKEEGEKKPEDIMLLQEIRDLLKKNKAKK